MDTVNVIDLRSDTVTEPTPAMRQAMAAAVVGDDGYHDDPTVRRLEETTAALLGKEAGLLVPSGTQANLIAALTLCPPGHAALALTNAHIAWTLALDPRLSTMIELVTVPDVFGGRADPADLNAAIERAAPPIGLVCIENTHNQAGGIALTPDELAPAIAVARRHGLPVHLDGARLFNAAVALDLSPATLAADADSVTIALTKGLAAPVGSVLCGSGEFIEHARHARHYLGGGMRQAGVIAAAGLVGLETMIPRLAEDHANARWLGDELARIPGLRVWPLPVPTNLVFFDVAALGVGAPEVLARLASRGIRLDGYEAETVIRAATHYGISHDDCAHAAAAIAAVVSELTPVAATDPHIHI